MARTSKIPLIAKPLKLEEIANYYNDSDASLRLYFSTKNPNFEQRFPTYTYEEVVLELNERIDELDRSTSLSLLAALEAVFRTDYKIRSEKRKKDALSKYFKEIFKNKEERASLDEDLLNAWKEHTSVQAKLIEDLKGAYKYRHWLAHGRHWTPKMGRPDYDYSDIYTLAERTINSFPFEE